MPAIVKSKGWTCFESDDVVHVAQALIALSGIISAIATEYAEVGVLSTGALLHCADITDEVIGRLRLDEIDLPPVKLPF